MKNLKVGDSFEVWEVMPNNRYIKCDPVIISGRQYIATDIEGLDSLIDINECWMVRDHGLSPIIPQEVKYVYSLRIKSLI